MSTTERLITEEVRNAILALLPRYPTKQAVTLPALHLVNDALGYVPPLAVVEVAGLLELAPAQVQDTLSFYGFFRQDKPQGRHRVMVCRSISCAARGGKELCAYLCEQLGIRPGETTPDGQTTLQLVECLGACDYAPAMLVGDQLHKNLTREKIDAFAESLGQHPPQET